MALLGIWLPFRAVLVATASVLWWYQRAWTGRPVNMRPRTSRTGELDFLRVWDGDRSDGRPNNSSVGHR